MTLKRELFGTIPNEASIKISFLVKFRSRNIAEKIKAEQIVTNSEVSRFAIIHEPSERIVKSTAIKI